MDAPIVQKFGDFYKAVYQLGKTMPKRERFGVHATLQNHALEAWLLAIAAALEAKNEKLIVLKKLRLEIELMKRLLRIMRELDILNIKIYLSREADLQEISRMANGWIKYVEK